MNFPEDPPVGAGAGVGVGVEVGIGDGVMDGVRVGVSVGVRVGSSVGVLVGRGVLVGSGGKRVAQATDSIANIKMMANSLFFFIVMSSSWT